MASSISAAPQAEGKSHIDGSVCDDVHASKNINDSSYCVPGQPLPEEWLITTEGDVSQPSFDSSRNSPESHTEARSVSIEAPDSSVSAEEDAGVLLRRSGGLLARVAPGAILGMWRSPFHTLSHSASALRQLHGFWNLYNSGSALFGHDRDRTRPGMRHHDTISISHKRISSRKVVTEVCVDLPSDTTMLSGILDLLGHAETCRLELTVAGHLDDYIAKAALLSKLVGSRHLKGLSVYISPRLTASKDEGEMADEMIELCKTVLMWISSEVKLLGPCEVIFTNSGFGELGKCQLGNGLAELQVWASERARRSIYFSFN